jgi:hypothetical protein
MRKSESRFRNMGIGPDNNSGHYGVSTGRFLMPNSNPTDHGTRRKPHRTYGWFYRFIFVGLFPALGFLPLSGCGGGGADGTPGASVGDGAGTAAVSWDVPTTNADGTPLADLAGYKVYYGTNSPINKDTSQSVDVGDSTSYTLTGLSTGTYYFAAVAYDTAGNESDLSEELSKAVAGT